jgi:RinA family phage transcriptional activator
VKPVTTLSRIDIQKIEEYWQNHDANKKQLKYREWELLTPYKDEEVDTGISSGGISKTTERRALALVDDKLYQNLQHIIQTVEKMYAEMDADTRVIVGMRYWDKGGCFEWDDIAEKLSMSRSRVLRKRNLLVDDTAKRIGWV